MAIATPGTTPSTSRWRLVPMLRALAVFGIFLLIAVIVFQPWLEHFSTVLIGPPENNQQDFWNVWYAARTNAGRFFETNLVRFPEGALLNYHSFTYPYVFAVAGLSQFMGSDRDTLVWLQNASLFLSFPLAGTGAFYLVRRFVPSDPASLVGGYIFAFNPSHVAQLMHHAHVTHIEFIPLFVLAYLNAVERKNSAWLGGAVVFGALSALCCWYYLFYIAYFMIFHVAYLHWHDKLPVSGWQAKAPLFCLLGIAAILSPLLLPMLMQTGTVDVSGGTDIFVADIEALFAFPPAHFLSSWSASFYARALEWTGNNAWEGTVYLGLVNIGLMIFLALRYRRHKDPIAAYVFWAMAVFTIVAAGDCIHAFGFDTLLPLPGLLLSHLPFFGQVRTPSRSIVLVYLFLSVGVAYALALLTQEWRGRWAKPALAAITILILADYYPANLTMTDARCPDGLNIIKNDPEQGFGVLNLPFYDMGDVAMFQQTCHGRPIVLAAISRSARHSLLDRIDKGSLVIQRAQLERARVKYLILDERGPWEEDRSLTRYRLRLLLVRRFPSLQKISWIAVRPSPPSIAKSAYLKTFPVLYRSADFTILRVW
jgi:hypothetical protein